MNVLSLFDGISCGRLALKKAGVHVKNYFSSEIKQPALLVANTQWSQDIKNRLGEVSQVSASTLPTINLLIGGSPCQDLSRAKHKGKGLEGEKSVLFFEYLRLLREVRPEYFLLENVRMPDKEAARISSLLGVRPIKLNSKYFSAQLRDRLYWTNIPQPEHYAGKSIFVNDILDCGYSDRSKARALLASNSRPLTSMYKAVHRYINKGFDNIIFESESHYEELKQHFDFYFKGKTALEVSAIGKNLDLRIYESCRYLTTRERERLQTIPEGYTEGLTKNEAAGVIGDAWTVGVISQLLAGIHR